MGRLDGKVVFITGAARGQGRSHAVRCAQEGADIIVTDVCAPITSSIAPPATKEDLDETVRLVEALNRRAVAAVADVRDFDALKAAADAGVAELGHLDVVLANAGVWSYGPAWEIPPEAWHEVVDIVLTGVWNTLRATVPTLIDQGRGGSVVITSSSLAVKPAPHMAHYVSAKHGLTGLMKTFALELSPHNIRVNTVNPATVNTPLVHNKPTYDLFLPGKKNPTPDDMAEVLNTMTLLPTPWIEPEDVSNAVLFLASEESRFITGTTLVLDAGNCLM
jgi:(+)-trans-carveol dehydrogenase